ncbi:MAG: alpha/beta hydrolase [Archangium gephyra]|uniref:Alpha/beta hydrolase n=1 Tax=Archangium gephyra TaxID=48 RepID=A0A2W5TH85_9BACT|nr:MAG: alpha/beta hydrolase [Archangium gephyra]
MRSLVLLLTVFSACASAPKVTRSYARINGMNLYYEVHGSGPEVVLIHGSFCTIDGCFGKLLPELAKTHRVIAMELQAHGHTADIDRTFTVTNLVGDVVALMDVLGVKKADVVGYSLGSSVALELALTRPGRVKKLVMATTAFSPDGVKPRGPVRLDDLKGTPTLEGYQRVAPHPEQLPRLVARINESDPFKAQSPTEISASKIPMLLVFADDDLVTREHAVEFFKLLDGQKKSRLAVIPGTTHATLMESASLAPLVNDFLR